MIGVVLAGGRSTRLGQDKVRLRLPGDGRDMLARTADLLAACTDGVVISCRAPDAGEETLALPGIRSIPDAKPGLGPLGGVWSALRELRQPILVLSCDLPFMDVPTLRRLIDARGARPPEALMTTFQQAETGFIEALVSIYEPACLPFFEEARARNLRQLNLVIPEKLQSRVVYTRAEALPFFNINFPANSSRPDAWPRPHVNKGTARLATPARRGYGEGFSPPRRPLRRTTTGQFHERNPTLRPSVRTRRFAGRRPWQDRPLHPPLCYRPLQPALHLLPQRHGDVHSPRIRPAL